MGNAPRVFLAASVALLLACGGSTTAPTQGSAALDTATTSGTSCDHCCTFTQGYWKNHPGKWPTLPDGGELVIGTATYTKDDLLAILETPVAGNGAISLAHQLIAAELNILSSKACYDKLPVPQAYLGWTALSAGTIPPVGDLWLAPGTVAPYVEAITKFNEGFSCE